MLWGDSVAGREEEVPRSLSVLICCYSRAHSSFMNYNDTVSDLMHGAPLSAKKRTPRNLQHTGPTKCSSAEPDHKVFFSLSLVL